MVSFVMHRGASEVREGLHVQSRSYWAPANIGPYSQAISVPLEGGSVGGRLVYVAGQIPLEPASMDIVMSSSVKSEPDDEQWVKEFALRVVLAMQHMWRIGTAMWVDWWVGAVAYLTGEVGGGEVEMKVRMAWRLWERIHTQPNDDKDDDEDEEPALDAWDIKYGGRAHEQMTSLGRPSLPNFAVLQRQSDDDTLYPHSSPSKSQSYPEAAISSGRDLALNAHKSPSPTPKPPTQQPPALHALRLQP